MRERPILFSAPMVRAILDGRKTQTRRVVKPQPPSGTTRMLNGLERDDHTWWPASGSDYTGSGIRCPYGVPGDRLWVRETHAIAGDLVAYDADGWCGAICENGSGGRLRIPHGFVFTTGSDAIRRGDADKIGARFGLDQFGGRWRPSIHMPRWASRLTLEVTGVRVERLQAITEADAEAEGVNGTEAATAKQDTVDVHDMTPHRAAFACLWESINADTAPWASNPWVWVVEFRRLRFGAL